MYGNNQKQIIYTETPEGKNTRKLEVVHKEVRGCTQGSWRLYTRKLEVVHKEIGGCLISYNLQLACIAKLEVI